MNIMQYRLLLHANAISVVTARLVMYNGAQVPVGIKQLHTHRKFIMYDESYYIDWELADTNEIKYSSKYDPVTWACDGSFRPTHVHLTSLNKTVV